MDEDDFIIREGRADKPIGTSPNPIIKKALENLYISIVGALDVGDFSTFLKEVADLSYEEAKDKMIREYGSPTQLSAAKMKAKSSEAASRLEVAEQETLAEQRTLEQEFVELDEIARKRLGENFELSRRNEELEQELKRLKEELAKAKPMPLGVPVPASSPAVPHGSMYDEYMRRINEVISIHDMNDLASEIFDIAEREEYYKLTKSDIAEILERLRKVSEKRAMQLAEMKITEKPIIKPKAPEEVTRRKREKAEVPEFFGTLPPHVMYRYGRPDPETSIFKDIPFYRDHELERTIIRNGLLLFPPIWYALPSEEKRSRYGWDLASAMQHAVEALHKFSWEDLNKDYGIPEKYVEAWKKMS